MRCAGLSASAELLVIVTDRSLLPRLYGPCTVYITWSDQGTAAAYGWVSWVPVWLGRVCRVECQRALPCTERDCCWWLRQSADTDTPNLRPPPSYPWSARKNNNTRLTAWRIPAQPGKSGYQKVPDFAAARVDAGAEAWKWRRCYLEL